MGRRLEQLRPGGAKGDALPVVVHDGGPGPVVCVVGNLHGDEVGGLFAIHALDEGLAREPWSGTVALYPSVNPAGLAARSRNVGVHGSDLNRAFPGDARGPVAERVAAALWADLLARRPALVVDLHSDAAHAVPYVVIDRVIAGAPAARAARRDRLVRASRATGVLAVWDYAEEDYRRFGLDRSLTGALVNHADVTAITVEVGPRRAPDPQAIEATVSLLHGLLRWVLTGESSEGPPARWRRITAWRAERSGVLCPLRRPGEVVAAGEPLAQVRSIDGSIVETVRAPEVAVVLSWPDHVWLAAGSAIGTFGIKESS